LKLEGKPSEEVRHKDKAAIQDRDYRELLATIVLGDFAGQFIKPTEDGGLVVKNLSDVPKH
jgi:hypothetical protein